MDSLKSPCTTSYRSSIKIMTLNCLVFEKIALLYFGDRQTDEQMDRPVAWSRSRCRERRRNRGLPLDSVWKLKFSNSKKVQNLRKATPPRYQKDGPGWYERDGRTDEKDGRARCIAERLCYALWRKFWRFISYMLIFTVLLTSAGGRKFIQSAHVVRETYKKRRQRQIKHVYQRRQTSRRSPKPKLHLENKK